ncbi:hypothetical protein ACFYSF_00130 [Streptomyces canus]|uniref:hypothetical protein n=1 Tax=Streptomyces canus TaxID=58343 RepID=UPI0036A6F4A6
MVTSSLGFVETTRTLGLMGAFPDAMAELERGVGEILLTPEVREKLTALVTYDKRMLEAALAAGLPGHAPE